MSSGKVNVYFVRILLKIISTEIISIQCNFNQLSCVQCQNG